MSQTINPNSYEATETSLSIHRLHTKILGLKEYLPLHNIHRLLDPIIYQITEITYRSRDQFNYIKRLEEENGVLRRAKRTTFDALKGEKELERVRVLWENALKEGYGEEVVREAELRVHDCKREVVRARGEAESAREALLEWVRREAECRI